MHIICLCAAWCGTCKSYQATFDAVAAKNPQVTFQWVDIETEPFASTSIDIENFPTLWIGNQTQAFFFGTVLPHQAVIENMLEKALQGRLTIADESVKQEADEVAELIFGE